MFPPDEIQRSILELLFRRFIRLTPRDLMLAVEESNHGISKKAVRDAVRELIADGRLIYTHHFSTSHLEYNFKPPVQISRRIRIVPPEYIRPSPRNTAAIKLLDGFVFGGGDHPTTRLIIEGLDEVLAASSHLVEATPVSVLDIGTGSGILALVALKLGVEWALGVDIDPAACDSARKNAALNRLGHRMEVGDHLPSAEKETTFDMIMANLRPPTLKHLFPTMMALSRPGALWLVSGFRRHEEEGLSQGLPGSGWRRIWRGEACDWVAWMLKLPEATTVA